MEDRLPGPEYGVVVLTRALGVGVPGPPQATEGGSLAQQAGPLPQRGGARHCSPGGLLGSALDLQERGQVPWWSVLPRVAHPRWEKLCPRQQGLSLLCTC